VGVEYTAGVEGTTGTTWGRPARDGWAGTGTELQEPLIIDPSLGSTANYHTPSSLRDNWLSHNHLSKYLKIKLYVCLPAL
jgi:hypothetical protein